MSGNSYAQQSLSGTWTAVSLTVSDQVYIDMEKDSIHIEMSFIKIYGRKDIKDSAGLRRALLKDFSKLVFTIDKEGSIYENSEHEKMGHYNASDNTITFIDNTRKKEKTLPVEMKDGLLKFVSPVAEDKVVLWCRKTN
ncbi:hypothetical protein [Ferruginibacter sp. HRS2-29]|uniref:hypothetical protein n=1 Tax=Ferruginibacter sp. HRS2-29 TaxID=2487334 RepID=UPI0020CDC958|nr:hypothetical protein [Ferruginibacter sp. HRS2-29]MCP9752050.1 hypothetical protein [Ferruginibacter sp. HRS2-29]